MGVVSNTYKDTHCIYIYICMCLSTAAASWPNARCVRDGPAGRQHVGAAGLLGRATHITRVRHGPTCLAALATHAPSAPGRRSPSLPLRRLMISSPSPSPSPLDKAMYIYIYIYIYNVRLFSNRFGPLPSCPLSVSVYSASSICVATGQRCDRPGALAAALAGGPSRRLGCFSAPEAAASIQTQPPAAPTHY